MIHPSPKPPKGRPKPDVIRRANKSDGRAVEICRTREAFEARRAEVGQRAGFRCQNPKCRRYAPLHNETIDRGEHYMPGVIHAGQAAHVMPRRMGGGSRDDIAGNLLWLCWICHPLQEAGKLVIA